MRGYFVRNIGSNRGSPRIWLQGQEISRANMAPGSRYDIHVAGGTIELRANIDGSRVVSSKRKGDEAFPVIDINSKELLALFDKQSAIRIVAREGALFLLPLATELRKRERLSRLRIKLENREPMVMGSISHGGGIATHAVREGLAEAGIPARLGFANEIRPELLEHAAKHNDAWDADTIPLAAPMQELAFDPDALANLPRADILEAGLPCSAHSTAGRAKHGLTIPEEHPLTGGLVAAAIVILARANSPVLLFENVVSYQRSASAAILRTQLRSMGYQLHEAEFSGAEFNAIDSRRRWFMVAVTEGIHFDWSMLHKPASAPVPLSDILDDIAPDDPAWREMAGLKAKMARDAAAGNNFKMRTFDDSATDVGTLTRGYSRVRSSDSKLKHPTDENLLRQFTAGEHARMKHVPEHLVSGLSSSLAHEVLGQGVIHSEVRAIGRAIGQALNEFREVSHSELVRRMSMLIDTEFASVAALAVADLRRPVPGVLYEGPITVSDCGLVIQDVGNGVGILHRALAIQDPPIGETLSVQYPKMSVSPSVTRIPPPRRRMSSSASEESSEQLSMF